MGTRKGRKKRVKQANPKLKRPAAYFHTGKGEPASATTSGDGVADRDDPRAVSFPPASTSNDQFLDGVLGLLKSQVDLDALEEEEGEGTGVDKSAPQTFLDHLPPVRRFAHMSTESEKKMTEGFGEFVVASAKNKATRTG